MSGKKYHLLFGLAILILALMILARQAIAATVYVSNIDGGVSVIDSTTNAITTTIPVGGTGITISPDGRSAWVGKYYSGIIGVIDTATNTVTGTIPVGTAPWDTAFTPDGKTAYVTDNALNVVWVIDVASKAVLGSPIPLGTSEATEITITPDGNFVYVVSICGNGPCSASSGTVSIIDTSSNTLIKTIPVGYFPNGIAMTANGAFAYIANQCEDLSCVSGGSVSVINTESQSITQTIPTGQFDSQFITIAPGGKLAYVANTCGDVSCSSSGTVSTIDLTTNSIIGSPIPIGGFPGELGVTPDGKFLYVVDQVEGVSVIATATNTVIATIPIAGHPAFLAITPVISFSQFRGTLRINPDSGVFYLSGGFTLGTGGSINPLTQQTAFNVGHYSVTVPAGSFFKVSAGYVYQKKVNNIFLCVYIKNTGMPGHYTLLAYGGSGALTNTTTSPVPVTLTVGNNSGSTEMNATFH